jgi:hydroxymethyl cephem carbamoyltransferase
VLVFALKPGHDGAVAVIRDRRLLYYLESEKDSFGRYAAVNVNTILDIAEHVDQLPDVVALGGWREQGAMRHRSAGYDGLDALTQRPMRFFGKEVRLFSHVRDCWSSLRCAVQHVRAGRAPLFRADGSWQ